MKDTYTKALLDLLASTDDVEQVVRGFARTLEARGHMALHAPVLQAVLRVLEAKRPDTIVTVKSDAQYKELTSHISEALRSLGAPADTAVEFDETMIGGYVVEHDHRRIDASYKTKLTSLYRSITT